MELIQLSLPLSSRHAATARVVAASLAADAGFTVDEIDDLRLGINEAVALLTDELPDAPDARLDLRIASGDGRIEVEIRPIGTSGSVQPDELARRILSAVVDEFEFYDGGCSLSKSSDGARPVNDREGSAADHDG